MPLILEIPLLVETTPYDGLYQSINKKNFQGINKELKKRTILVESTTVYIQYNNNNNNNNNNNITSVNKNQIYSTYPMFTLLN